MKATDRDAIERTVRGDREAFGALVDAYQGMAFAVALNITGNYEDSQDIVQEAFVRAFERLRTLSDPGRFAAWFYTLTRRLALQFLRDRRRVPVVDLDEALFVQIETDAESPAEAYARKELSGLLWGEVAQLPPKAREAIFLFYMEGFSVRRAAEFLGIAEGAFKARLHFAREKLRERFLGDLGEELRRRQPGGRQRNAVLAALPPGFAPAPKLVGPSAPPPPLAPTILFATKKTLWVAAALLVGALSILFFLPRPPRPSAPPIPARDREPSDTAQTNASGPRTDGASSPTIVLQGPATKRFAVAGTVRERLSNKPVAQVPVILRQRATVLQTTAWNENGAFRFDPVPPGDYTVEIPDEQHPILRRFYLPAPERSIRVRVSDSDVGAIAFVLQPAGAIAGRVVDDRGQPIATATVQLQEFPLLRNPYARPVDSEGHFLFDALFPAADYLIAAQAPGFLDSPRRVVEARMDDPVELVIALRTGSGATLLGRVVNRKGQPVESAIVRLVPGTSTRSRVFITDRDGKFQFMKVSPGSIILLLEQYNDARVPLMVKGNETIRDLEFVVDQEILEGRVAGRVLDAMSQPVTQGDVYAVRSGEGSGFTALAQTGLGPDGAFVLANLPPREPVDIFYRGPTGPPRLTKATDVLVPQEGLLVFLEPEEPPQSPVIVRGRVVDQDTDRPVPQFLVNFNIDAYFRHPLPGAEQVADPEGRFKLETTNWIPRRTFLYVKAPGYAARFEPVPIESAPCEMDLTVSLSRGPSIAGRVQNGEATPVGGARVYMRLYEDKYVLTGDDGTFALSGVTPGDACFLRVAHRDYCLYTSPRMNLTGDEAINDLIVTLTAGGAVEGYVFDDEAEPVSGAVVEIVDENAETRFSPQTDSSGAYEARRIPPGRYTVALADRPADRKTIDVRDNQSVPVDFGPVLSVLTGTVVSEGKPCSSLQVVVADQPYSARGRRLRLAAITDTDGKYSISGIPLGSYYLNVLDSTPRLLHSEPLDVPASSDVRRDIELRLVSIRGRALFGPDQSPVSDATIAVLPPQALDSAGAAPFVWRHVAIAAVASQADGTFVVDRVPEGRFTLYGTSPTRGEARTPLTLAMGVDIGDVLLTFGGAGSLRVTVLDPQGQRPLLGRTLLYLRYRDGPLQVRVLGPQAPSEVTGLPAGTLSIAAIADTESGATFVAPYGEEITLQDGETREIAMQTLPARLCRLTLLDTAGRAVPALPSAIFTLEGRELATFPMEEGQLRAPVPPGKARVIVGPRARPVLDVWIEVPGADSPFLFERTFVVNASQGNARSSSDTP